MMRKSDVLSAATAAVWCLCTAAFGQTFNTPRYFVWGNYPGGYAQYQLGPNPTELHYPAAHDPYMTNMIFVYTGGMNTAASSARLAARYIKARIDVGNMLSDEVCLTIESFGFDDRVVSAGMTGLPLRFFCREDRQRRPDGTTAIGFSAAGFDGRDAYTWTEAGGLDMRLGLVLNDRK